MQPRQGAARLLLDAVKDAAKARGATRLKAMLTNDNMPGMIFYQLQGFRFSGLYVEAIDHYRSVIPTIIATGFPERSVIASLVPVLSTWKMPCFSGLEEIRLPTLNFESPLRSCVIAVASAA